MYVCQVFVDFKQVYVSIDRNTVLEIMNYFSYQVSETGISNIGRSKSGMKIQNDCTDDLEFKE